MEEKIVFCKGGGCTAKLGAGILQRVLDCLPRGPLDRDLLVGFDSKDDAAVYRVTDDIAIVQTLDFFPPMVDDPYTFGRIAAANALSDVYAMGGEPKLALNLMCVPEKMPREAVHQMLRGGYDKVYEAGCLITGGHSIFDEEPKYGLAVTGFVHPDRILTNSGARPGDVLLLTKPLGVGILTTAYKGGLLTLEEMEPVYRQMTTLNKAARDVMVQFPVHACTDVTGFSLMGHLLEMVQGSGVRAAVHTSEVDVLAGAAEMARMGVLPEGMYRNRTFAQSSVDMGDTPLYKQDVLFDPQTAGGLLIAVDPGDADALFAELRDCVPSAQRIGEMAEWTGGARILLR